MSGHMKFIKRAFGEFNEFHVNELKFCSSYDHLNWGLSPLK